MELVTLLLKYHTYFESPIRVGIDSTAHNNSLEEERSKRERHDRGISNYVWCSEHFSPSLRILELRVIQGSQGFRTDKPPISI